MTAYSTTKHRSPRSWQRRNSTSEPFSGVNGGRSVVVWFGPDTLFPCLSWPIRNPVRKSYIQVALAFDCLYISTESGLYTGLLSLGLLRAEIKKDSDLA